MFKTKYLLINDLNTLNILLFDINIAVIRLFNQLKKVNFLTKLYIYTTAKQKKQKPGFGVTPNIVTIIKIMDKK
ncbi:MAG TPA: hypothetical protein V6C58_13200 [Allocoleopsis sp.]